MYTFETYRSKQKEVLTPRILQREDSEFDQRNIYSTNLTDDVQTNAQGPIEKFSAGPKINAVEAEMVLRIC